MKKFRARPLIYGPGRGLQNTSWGGGRREKRHETCQKSIKFSKIVRRSLGQLGPLVCDYWRETRLPFWYWEPFQESCPRTRNAHVTDRGGLPHGVTVFNSNQSQPSMKNSDQSQVSIENFDQSRSSVGKF